MADLYSTTNETQPGYFRIGFVVLQIPPSDITTNKVINDDQISTLRTSSPMFIKSGQARWDVTVHWKAVRVISSQGILDVSQWEDLQNIVAIFRASPFVEVENSLLRQHFVSVQAASTGQSMAFALRQLRIDTDPSSTNVLDVTLTMSWFNFSPFSLDFSYVDSTTGGADGSQEYKDFISNWIDRNITTSQGSTPSIRTWTDQTDGVLTFKWRTYNYVLFPVDQPPASAISSSSSSSSTGTVSAPAKTTTPPSSSKRLSSDIQGIVNSAASANGIPTTIATALCIAESSGNPNAGMGRVGAGLGLFQLTATTARGLGVTNVWDPAQNANGGCKYLAQQYKKFGNWPQALAAYNVGAGAVSSYVTGKPLVTSRGTINPQGIISADGIPPNGTSGENPQTYVKGILAAAGMSNLITSVPVKSTNNQPLTTPTTVVMGDNPDQKFIDNVNGIISSGSLPPGTWHLDHYTEQGAFFFQENDITFATADSDDGGEYNMFVGQMSIVLVNNLPTIPLSAMQYPTYQHVGPSDTMISISFDSVGDDDGVFQEPEHEGIEALVAMSTQLENQFQSMAPLFRAVSSIQRMQSIYIENQILNLVGIRGVMLRGLNTETVPESSNLIQVGLMASQYENIFEDINPFIMNGIPKAYSAPLSNILLSGQLSQLSADEQKTLTVIQQFATAWQNKDPKFLLQEILKFASNNIDYLTRVASSIPDANLRADQKALLLANLDLQSTGANESVIANITQAISTIFVPNTTISNQSAVYPALQTRRLALQKSNADMSFADYFVFSQLPAVGDGTATIITSEEAAFASQEPTIYSSMYSALFDIEVLADSLFAREATLITTSPTFKAQFTTAVTVEGPATQVDSNNNPINPGHSCYRDLGLTDYTIDPASYFKDWNEQLNININQEINNVLGTATQTANQTNQQQTGFSGQNQTSQQEANGITVSANGQGIPGNASALIRSQNTPAYSMAHAYPTFKLLLLEEDNTGPFYCFDNFYSYASVIDIEVIKYRDKPDTAIIQITNLAHTLQHRLYDDTAAGKMESMADKFNVDPNSGLIINSKGQTEVGTGGGSLGSGITAGRTGGGTPYIKTNPRYNMTEGRNEASTRVPLKFYALQTGSKIQVRLGFSNNPDNLYPVFTGQITSIEGSEILTLTCQSFMLELMNNPGTMVKADSIWGFNFLTGGAAFGEYSIMNSGDTLNIMKTMLASPVARHFGHWQIGSQIDPKIKGFTWAALAGSALSSTSSSTLQTVGGLLQTGYDRSGENVLVNSVINFDGTQTANSSANMGSRTFNDENPNLVLGTTAYSIPKQSKMSIWEIIRDVARRYPNYNLMVRDYGFPYGADATLVYAHPLDWYYTRPPLLGEAEKEKANNTTQGQLFSTWWATTGLNTWNHIFQTVSASSPSFLSAANLTGSAKIIQSAMALAYSTETPIAGSGPEGFGTAIQDMHDLLTGQTSSTLKNAVILIANFGNISGNEAANIDENFQALYKLWIAYLTTSESAANTARVKPVRKYHLIDHNHIVHNGIKINDNIYNAVKIGDKKPLLFNQNIPDQHVRVLDVTDMINNPDKNVLQGFSEPFLAAYAQSFLRDEVGKMYQGELIVRGAPEIEPFDIILLNDVQSATVGPIEVESVIHSFNQENGYITIIRPKLMLIMNEAVSQAIIQILGRAWANSSAELLGLKDVFNLFNVNTTTSATILDTLAIATGALAVSGLIAGTAATMLIFSLPLLAGAGILAWGYLQSFTQNNLFSMMPLSRFGRPWVGGVQGFSVSDFAYSLGTSFRWFDAEEIAPTIESWDELTKYTADFQLATPK